MKNASFVLIESACKGDYRGGILRRRVEWLGARLKYKLFWEGVFKTKKYFWFIWAPVDCRALPLLLVRQSAKSLDAQEERLITSP